MPIDSAQAPIYIHCYCSGTVAMHMCMQFFFFWIHREGHDRTDIGLPGKQDQLLQAIKGVIAKTTPMIVVLMSGGPVDITTAKVQSVCSLQTMLTD